MIYDKITLFEEYQRRIKNARMIIDQVKFIIGLAVNREGIKIHYIFDRIKEFNSFVEKIERKDIQKPFDEIHDLIGIRIICLFLEDVTKIGDLVKKEFDVFEIANKIDEVNPDVFGYMSSHYKARFQDRDVIIPIAKEYTFEIQIRTIAQDAWASISHYLLYKQESSLPQKLIRDFHALSGLFYVADTHFSLLRGEQLKFLFKQVQEIEDATAGK